MSKKVLCVIRTSTERQELESQHNDMLDFLHDKYKEDEIEWLEVSGASARKANEKYLLMLETIKAKIKETPTIEAAAFWHLNRLGRIEEYINHMKKWFADNKIQVYVKTPILTLLNPDGSINAGANISWSVFASIVAYDTEEMMDKFKRGKAANKSNNKYNGGRETFGFTHDKQGYNKPDFDKLKIVKMMYEEYATGKYSIQKLFEELLERGHKFGYSHIFIILSNKVYIPYVGQELFDKVQAIKKSNDLGLNTKEYKYLHLCNKLIKCPYCGRNYIPDSYRYVCYTSKHYKRIFTNKCSESATIKSSIVDTIVWDIAFIHNSSSLLRTDEKRKQELEKQKNILLEKLNNAENKIADCAEKKNRWIEMYGNLLLEKKQFDAKMKKEKDDEETYSKAKNGYLEEIKNIDKKISSLQKPNLIEQLSLINEDDIKLQDAKKKEIVHKFIDNIKLYRTEFNNRKAIKIVVNDINGKAWTFINDFYKRSKRDIDNVKQIKNGIEYPYIVGFDGSNPSSRAEQLKDNFKEFVETSIVIESILHGNKFKERIDELKEETEKLVILKEEMIRMHNAYD